MTDIGVVSIRDGAGPGWIALMVLLAPGMRSGFVVEAGNTQLGSGLANCVFVRFVGGYAVNTVFTGTAGPG